MGENWLGEKASLSGEKGGGCGTGGVYAGLRGRGAESGIF